MARTAVLLSALLALAGCGGPVGGGLDRGGGSPDGTLTPAPVPDAGTGTADRGGPDRLTPGLTADGAVDPLELGTAHAVVLRRTDAYALSAERTVYGANGSVRAAVDQRARVDGRRFRVAVAVRGRPGIVVNRPPAEGVTRAVFWSDGRELVERIERDGATTYLWLPPDRYERGGGFHRSLRRPKPWLDVGAVLGAVDLRVVARRTDGERTVYRLCGEGLDEPGLFEWATRVDDPRNVSLSATVDDRGFVKRFALTYGGRTRAGPVRVERTAAYGSLGTATAPRPDWYETARNESMR